VQLQKHYTEIARLGVRLFAISVDPPEASEALRQRLGIDFTFLSDSNGQVLDLLGIRHQGARRSGADIAYPAQVLVDQNGTVRWIYTADSYRVRARPEDVFAAIRALPG
jgi:peroxiredoxin